MTHTDRPEDVDEGRDAGPGTAAAVRSRVADNLGLVVVALVLLSAIGGWVAYGAHVNPPMQPTEQTVGSVETEGSYEHGAVVRSENPVYPDGSVLTDRHRYFRSVAPVLNGTFTHEYAATGEDIEAETTLRLRLRSADDGGEYWSTTEPLTDPRVDTGDSGTVAVPFEVNVSEAAWTIARTDNELGGSPGDPEIAVVAETSVTATVEGERVTTTETHVLSIVPTGSTYTVEGAGRSASDRVTETGRVSREYGPLASYGSVLLFAGALGSLALVVGLTATDSLRPPQSVHRAVTTARERDALDEWITTGRVPAEHRTGPTVTVSSLSGLVDVGIDSDRRVIEDERTGAFYVVDDGVVYVYHSERATSHDALDGTRVGHATPSSAPSDDDGSTPERDEASDGTGSNGDLAEEFEWQGESDEFEWSDPNADERNEV